MQLELPECFESNSGLGALCRPRRSPAQRVGLKLNLGIGVEFFIAELR